MDTMNRNSDVLNTNSITDLRVPSGWEVESTTISSPMTSSSSSMSSRSGLQGHLDTFKSSCKTTYGNVKSGITDKINEMKPVVTQKIDSLRNDVSQRVSSTRSLIDARVHSMRNDVELKTTAMKNDMSSNPAKWAGIAAGAGLGLGLLGRYLRHRAHRPMPQFVIIETCA